MAGHAVGILDKLKAFLAPSAAKTPPSLAKVTDALGEARRRLHLADTAAEAIESEANYVLGDDLAWRKNRSDLQEALADRERMERIVTHLEGEAVAASTREAEAARVAAYAAAKTGRDVLAERIRREYPAAANAIVALIRAAAENEIAIARANADLPKGFLALETAEYVARAAGAAPRKTIADDVIDLWVPQGSMEPASPDLQAKIEVDPTTGLGFIRTIALIGAATEDPFRLQQASGGVSHISLKYFERKKFRRIEFLDSAPGAMPLALATASLPPVHGGVAPVWDGVKPWEIDPRLVLAQAEKLADQYTAASTAAPDRRRRVEFTLIAGQSAGDAPAPATEAKA